MPLLLTLLSDWMTVIDKECYLGAVFLNLCKAFDTVNHGILLDNLREVGLTFKTLCWFQNQLGWQSLKKRCKLHTEPGRIDASDQVLPLLVYMTYFSLSTNSINIILR